jgi:UV DNA damage endonuclease
LSSPNQAVTRKSVEELRYQADVAQWINADVINIHGGGAYGNKPAALRRLIQQIQVLPEAVRKRLTVENDDRVYTPRDLLPVCNQTGIPLVYDVHHHRCLPDGLSVAQATEEVLKTWQREPVFHLSSPLNGYDGGAKNKHHDYIDPEDFPINWMNLNITVEVEAKAKELAVLKIKKHIHHIVRQISCRPKKR